MEIILILGVIALLVLFVVAQYNRLVRLNITVDEAFAQIEVQLKRRADLIPNLVETVKGYAKHEQSTFDAVVEARAKSTSASTIGEVAAADGAVVDAPYYKFPANQSVLSATLAYVMKSMSTRVHPISGVKVHEIATDRKSVV